MKTRISLFKKFRHVTRDLYKVNTKDIAQLIIESDLNNHFISASASQKPGVCDTAYCDHQIIVSLTSFGTRLSLVYLAIESLMRQTMLANRIILWLDPGLEGKTLPVTLQQQIKRGLEIKYYHSDIRSYKKLIPTLELCPNDAIITVDDDCFYDITALENLITTHIEHPQDVCYNRGHEIKIKKNQITPYHQWPRDSKNTEPSPLNFPTGCGGILYPPNSLHPEVLNQDVFTEICGNADDVWFYAMALLNGRCSRKAPYSAVGKSVYFSTAGQEDALWRVNQTLNQNDTQLKNVLTKYKLYSKLGIQS